MKRLAALIFLAATLAATEAHADPISALISAGVSALLGASTAGTIIAGTLTIGQLVTSAIVTAGAVGLSLLTSGGQKSSATSVDPSEAKSTFTAEESTVYRLVGRGRIGGVKVFGNTVGADRYRLLLHAKSITAVEQYFLGGREVVVDDDGFVASVPWSYSGGSYALLSEDNGSVDKAAWPALKTAFPALWTDAHWARGIAQTLIRYKNPGLSSSKYLSLYSGGAPDLEKVMRGEAIYDPRTGETAWTDNGILIAYHVHMALDGRMTIDDYDLDTWIAEADKADEPVATRDGFEPRCRIWGIFAEESKRADVLQDVLDSGGIEQIMVGDKIAFRLVDDVRVAEATIDPEHVLSVSDTAGPQSVERPNVCVVKYYSEERNFELAEIDMTGIAWARIDDEIAATGVQEKTIELKLCPSASQAQRIARRKFAMARANAGTLKTNFAGLAVWGARVVAHPSPDDDMVLSEIGAPKVDDENGTVEIAYTEIPVLTPWNPTTDEAKAPDTIPEIAIDAALTTPDAPIKVVVVTLIDGTVEARVAYSVAAYTPELVVRAMFDRARTKWQLMNKVAAGALTWARRAGDYASADEIKAKVRVYSGNDSSNWSDVGAFAKGKALVPVPPTIASAGTGTTRTVTVTAPADIACVGLLIWQLRNGVSTRSTVTALPGQAVPLTVATGTTFSAATLASRDGPQSDWISANI